MRILVLNGSPKGKNSITLQTVEYLKLKFTDHDWETLHVGQLIALYEKDFTKAKEALDRAELIIFSYPVYTFIAPYQLHRFVELMKAHNVDVAGKWASQISTSKHFYDVTAHRYVMENAIDMGMKFVRGLSADMDDLTTQRGREEAESFFRYLMWCVENGCCEPDLPVQPVPAHVPATTAEATGEKSGDVVILTDCRPEDTQLQGMIDRFRAVCPKKTRVINLREYPFKGGCLGCFNCAVDGTCIYTDGFDQFLRTNIQGGQSIVYAFSIKDHSMGALFKLYDDRQFCNGHRTVTMGMPMGYLVSGNYSEEFNLQMIIEGRAEVGGNFLAGVATDEQDPNTAIDALAATLSYALEHKHTQPQNFYGVGGMKIFRDLIYLMQGMMKADHKFYKAHGQYDFPQKKKGTLVKMYLVGSLLSNPKLKSKMGNSMNEGMIAPYKKALDSARKRANKH